MHEDVVDGQRFLDDVAGEELERGQPGGLLRVEAGDRHQAGVGREGGPGLQVEPDVEEEREREVLAVSICRPGGARGLAARQGAITGTRCNRSSGRPSR